MPTYQCRRCRRIVTLSKALWQLTKSICTGCSMENPWTEYDGPMAPTVLMNEASQVAILEKRYATLEGEIQTATLAKDGLAKELKTLNNNNNNNTDLELLQQRLRLCLDVILEREQQLQETVHELKKFDPVESVQRDALKVGKAAATVGEVTGKNKLYVGSRNYVSAYVMKDRQKKLRILDASNWSWGLNLAWVEGGIAGGAVFKLKMSDTSPYYEIPQDILTKMIEQPNMTAEEFLDLCEQGGRNSLLWYDNEGENRPTWTALEIAALLRSGYTFTAVKPQYSGNERVIYIPL